MNRHSFPADRVFIAYNLVLAAVWSGTGLAGWTAPVLTWLHLAAAAGTVALRRSEGRAPRWTLALRSGYPLPAIALAWSELGLLHRLVPRPPHDAVAAAWDRALFGGHPHELWGTAHPEGWLGTAMFAAYLSYYLLVFVPPLVLAARGNGPGYRDAAFRLLVTYLGCDLLYLAFPVYGPRFAGAEPLANGGALAGLAEGLRALGDSPGTAFPSSHVAGAVTAAIVAHRWFPRPLPVLWIAGALAVAVSTVYTRNHFAVDALAGGVWALLLQFLVVPRIRGGSDDRKGVIS
jgi:membrane-associated phospholipid phosphatase